MKTCFTFLLCLTTCFSLQAQTTDTLTNKAVIKLKSAGLSSDIIKSTILASPCKFDLSVDGLIALKKSGLSEDVINTMVGKNSSLTAKTENSNASSDNSLSNNNSSNDISSGVYYCKGNPCNLIDIEASVYSQAKIGSGIMIGLTYGIAKTKMKATLSGEKSQMQIEVTNPVFYFYFDKSNSNSLGNNGSQFLFASATSPNEFLLVKFSIAKKNREVVTGSVNSYAGMTSGIDNKCKVPFKYEKTSQGVYKVYTDQPLAKGEYCFMYAGSAASTSGNAQRVYDFGID